MYSYEDIIKILKDRKFWDMIKKENEEKYLIESEDKTKNSTEISAVIFLLVYSSLVFLTSILP